MTVSGVTGVEIVMVSRALAVKGMLLVSVTCTVKLKDPAAVGVPVMAPVVALKVSPPGSEPFVIVTALSGVVPPIAVIVVL